MSGGEPIRGSIADFWHDTSDHKPASYTAYAILTYHCGKCGLQLKKEGPWPQYCARGDRNERPDSNP